MSRRTGGSEQQMRMEVGRRLLVRRIWLRMPQAVLADKSGVSRNFVSAMERGSQGLDAYRLRLIAGGLGVSLDWLLSGPDDGTVGPLTSRPESS